MSVREEVRNYVITEILQMFSRQAAQSEWQLYFQDFCTTLFESSVIGVT